MKMKLAVVLLGFLTATSVFAHSGGTAGDDCHYDTSDKSKGRHSHLKGDVKQEIPCKPSNKELQTRQKNDFETASGRGKSISVVNHGQKNSQKSNSYLSDEGEIILITTEGFESATEKNMAYVSRFQIYLNVLGYKAGIVNGSLTPATIEAISAYQKDRDMPEDGEISFDLYQRLKEDADTFYK